MAFRNATSLTGTSTTPNTAVPTGAAIDDIVLLFASVDSTTATFATKWPAGFTAIADIDLTHDGQAEGWAWKRLTAADTGSYTLAAVGISTQWICMAVCLSGRDTTNPPVFSAATQNNTANATPVTISATGVTALAGDDLVWASLPDNKITGNVTGHTPPSGYTEKLDVGTAFTYGSIAVLENASAGATGTVSGTLTLSSSTSGYGATLVRVPVAVGGGVSVTPTTASLVTAGFAPTVIASDHKLVTPSMAPLTISTFAPTIVIGVGVVPSTASLTTSTFAPSVSISNNQSVIPTTANLVTSTFAPTVLATAHQFIIPSTASLTITRFAPIISVTANQAVTPTTASLTITTFAPSVSVSAGLTLTPGTSSVTLSTFAPTVTTSDHKIVIPSTKSLTLTTYSPTVSTGAPAVSKIMFNLSTGKVSYKISEQYFIEL